MIIDIITVILFVIVALKFIIIEVKLDELSKRLEDTISRNNVQHENIEKEVHYINRQYHKLHLSKMYGRLVSEEYNEYLKQDIEALKESLYRFYADTDSIKVEKED